MFYDLEKYEMRPGKQCRDYRSFSVPNHLLVSFGAILNFQHMTLAYLKSAS